MFNIRVMMRNEHFYRKTGMYVATAIIVLSFLKLGSADILFATKNGPIQGVKARFAEDVEAFLGIPYAEPPVGDLRFAKPVAKKRWDDTFIASNMPPPCSQFSFGELYVTPDLANMSEDCLYLNLWVPKSKSDDGLRPIIIFLHQGMFSVGAANQYDGSKFASHGDLIVAIINYRLGAFGYFMANVEEAPGNMGMYDQVMAIQWIKDNAEIFGGNPENIVLMGESAGAVSISAHMVSPLSKHLFRRAIMLSGSTLHPYFEDNSGNLKNAKVVASIVGCSNDTVNLGSDPKSVVRCLKGKPKEVIIEAEKTITKSSPTTFLPRMNDAFLPKSPADLYREGKFRKDVDVLMGFNQDEGTIMLTFGVPEYFGRYGHNSTQSVTKNFVKLLMRGFSMVASIPRSEEIINYYLSRTKIRTSAGYRKTLANNIGDFIVNCPTVFNADLFSLKGNAVYFYMFAVRPTSTPTAEWVGATHLDELQYILGVPVHDNFTRQEVELSNRMMDRWAAFARTGNPNVAGHMPWLRYSYDNPIYLNFGQEEESLRLNPLDRRCEVWRERFRANVDKDLVRFLRNSGTNGGTS